MESLLEKLHITFSPSVSNVLRNLANGLEEIVERSLENFDESFAGPKIELTVRAAHLIRELHPFSPHANRSADGTVRFLDLHQLSSALTPILGSATEVRSMINAWSHIDIDNLTDQCALSCNCNQKVLGDILEEFRTWLVDIDGNGVIAARRLGAWADKVLHEFQIGSRGPQLPLRVYVLPPIQERTYADMHSLVIRTGFITSQIMRDFVSPLRGSADLQTIRSEPAFGLFQLVKTWIDDWVAIKALLQTALSSHSLNPPPPPFDMTVAIPEGGPREFRDLNTAVPQYSFNKNVATPRPVDADVIHT